MIRIKIMDILTKHLKKIDGLTYGRWLAGEIDSDQLPIIDVRDKKMSKDNDSGHTLHIDIVLSTKSKARGEHIDETLMLMQKISDAFYDAVKEMCFSGGLEENYVDVEKSEYKFFGALMKYKIYYTADEWSV